ncbi:MAG: bifunctional hydroxymethylpyrimidine kinase/phosphomethylpyrimidine kinase, partial [Corynebacterium propinquum]
MKTNARILSIAGTDPTGGAGVQADLKSIAAAGGFGMSVVTALVAQNTQGVRSIHTPPQNFLREQLASVADDVELDAVKIGMLGDSATVDTVSEWLRGRSNTTVVLDPVMVASSGDRLLQSEAEAKVRELCKHVDVITPNLKELAVLVEDDEATDFDAAVEGRRRPAHRPGRGVGGPGDAGGGQGLPGDGDLRVARSLVRVGDGDAHPRAHAHGTARLPGQ